MLVKNKARISTVHSWHSIAANPSSNVMLHIKCCYRPRKFWL